MFSFWIRKRIFSLISFFLKPVLKFEIEFDEGVSEKIIKETEAVYVIASDSVTDLVALQLASHKLNITQPLSKILNSPLNKFICLKSPIFSQKEQKIIRQPSYNLQLIIELDNSLITLFPTSFYWGKHPDKQKSLFKILFLPILVCYWSTKKRSSKLFFTADR